MPILGIMASQISGHLYDGPYGAYDSLATVTLSASTATVTFAGIPAGYKHLQIRLNVRTDRPTYGINAMDINSFNGDTAANYSSHYIEGDGSTAYAGASANNTKINIGQIGTTVVGNFGSTIIDILDYTDANKYKTIRVLSGTDCNGLVAGFGGCIGLYSGSWRSTAALTSVKFSLSNSVNFTQYSSFALYGVR